MANQELTTNDRERFEAARHRGKVRSEDPSAVIAARYDADTDEFRLQFRGGGVMMIPRRLVPGLNRRRPSVLESISVSPAGDALRWDSIDADVYVPGLVEQAFGHRLFAAAAGRRGGSQRSKVKAAAARRNGAQGGRPKKQPMA